MYHTVGVWHSAEGTLVRCIFLTPEIATSTLIYPSASFVPLLEHQRHLLKSNDGRKAFKLVEHSRSVQILGRAAPYVPDESQVLDERFTCANVSKSKFLFLVSIKGDVAVCSMSSASAYMLVGFRD